MKKTIIALMALAGVATADTLEKLWSIDFTTLQREGNKVTIESGDYEFTVWDGTLSSAGITSNYTPPTSVNGNNRPGESISRVHIVGDTGMTWGDDFAVEVVFTLPSNFDHHSNWPAIFNMYGNGNNDNLRFGPYVDITSYGVDGVSADALPKPEQDWTSVTLTTGEAHTALLYVVDGAVTLTIDGAVAAKATLNTGYYTPSTVIDNMLIGGHTGNNNGPVANHGWNMDVTVSSLSMYKVVPEPATATLSLLALCGLAARRRRK